MFYRKNGEEEVFSFHAMKWLVMVLKQTPDKLGSLITAVTSRGTQPDKCVIIRRPVTDQIRICQIKKFPHVLYARIWRWPDAHKDDMRHIETCEYGFDLKRDFICVNPYHYERLSSLGKSVATIPDGTHEGQCNEHNKNICDNVNRNCRLTIETETEENEIIKYHAITKTTDSDDLHNSRNFSQKVTAEGTEKNEIVEQRAKRQMTHSNIYDSYTTTQKSDTQTHQYQTAYSDAQDERVLKVFKSTIVPEISDVQKLQYDSDSSNAWQECSNESLVTPHIIRQKNDEQNFQYQRNSPNDLVQNANRILAAPSNNIIPQNNFEQNLQYQNGNSDGLLQRPNQVSAVFNSEIVSQISDVQNLQYDSDSSNAWQECSNETLATPKTIRQKNDEQNFQYQRNNPNHLVQNANRIPAGFDSKIISQNNVEQNVQYQKSNSDALLQRPNQVPELINSKFVPQNNFEQNLQYQNGNSDVLVQHPNQVLEDLSSNNIQQNDVDQNLEYQINLSDAEVELMLEDLKNNILPEISEEQNLQYETDSSDALEEYSNQTLETPNSNRQNDDEQNLQYQNGNLDALVQRPTQIPVAFNSNIISQNNLDQNIQYQNGNLDALVQCPNQVPEAFTSNIFPQNNFENLQYQNSSMDAETHDLNQFTEASRSNIILQNNFQLNLQHQTAHSDSERGKIVSQISADHNLQYESSSSDASEECSNQTLEHPNTILQNNYKEFLKYKSSYSNSVRALKVLKSKILPQINDEQNRQDDSNSSDASEEYSNQTLEPPNTIRQNNAKQNFQYQNSNPKALVCRPNEISKAFNGNIIPQNNFEQNLQYQKGNSDALLQRPTQVPEVFNSKIVPQINDAQNRQYESNSSDASEEYSNQILEPRNTIRQNNGKQNFQYQNSNPKALVCRPNEIPKAFNSNIIPQNNFEKNLRYQNDNFDAEIQRRNQMLDAYRNRPSAKQFISNLPALEYWCSIAYYELHAQVGELFKAKSCQSRVSVDGFTEPYMTNRFCLGALTNCNRSHKSEITLRHIGRGVTLELRDVGDIWLKCESTYSVYVHSEYLNELSGNRERVHKIQPATEIKIFDLGKFYNNSKHRVSMVRDEMAAVLHRTIIDSLRTNRTLIKDVMATKGASVDDLRRSCIMRLSFVKGWGPEYPRYTIKETPCWIEIIPFRALQVLDELLNMPI